MKQILKIERFYVKPPVNTTEFLNELDWYRRSDAPVQAALTDWDLSGNEFFQDFVGQVHVLYPKYKIQDLWIATYSQGDYSEAHDHRGFDWSFVWYLDTCNNCTPLCFPNIKKPWLPPHVVYPKVGDLYFFHGDRHHYVCPHICEHERIVVSGNLIHRTVN